MKNLKRILLSLVVISATAGLVLLGTSAYFSDTETSTGNTFAAGAIDLRVDSMGHYNGLTCVDNKWQECILPVDPENMVENGSFEVPEVTDGAGWQIFSSIDGWTIEWATDEHTYNSVERPNPALQEYHEGVNGWLAYDGNQYAELDSDWDGPGAPLNNEPALVKISQDIATTPGATYQLEYAFSARPNTASGDNQLNVYVEGDLVATNSKGNATNQTDWDVYTKIFVAEDSSTKITFEGDGTNNSLGVFLDDVKVYAMECTPSEEFTQECTSTWDLTDLGPDSPKFFDFSDIKPGDYGENTISLHVYNNDAYACMYINDLQDTEVESTEPELEAEGLQPEDENLFGELGENMHFFAWQDDGNNIWEDGEKPLFGETAIPYLGNDVLNDKVYPLFTPTLGAMTGGDTQYIGLAWCAGTMTVNTETHAITCDGASMGNNTQADALTFDVMFYVEQARNNEGFTCDRVFRDDQKPQ